MIEKTIHCPYCGERISILVDDSESEQSYTEDCEVCCRPIVFDITTNLSGNVMLHARCENE